MTDVITPDAIDPIVVLLAWALTYAAGRYAVPKSLRGALPLVAVLGACALRAGGDALLGTPLDLETFLHAVGAAGVAVLGHSQFRELQKAIAKPIEPDSAEVDNEQ